MKLSHIKHHEIGEITYTRIWKFPTPRYIKAYHDSLLQNSGQNLVSSQNEKALVVGSSCPHSWAVLPLRCITAYKQNFSG
jgi:hypothetical protein